ncbi:MAG: hypothetical protein EOO85_13475 [Pedobacter sp.]|nr:MAG: hypothetical protein EOO85_13475 [Pedobacter sp.]
MSLTVEQAGTLKGPFRGFKNRQTRFTFSNGVVWRQDEAKYFYFYAANPRARVIYKDGVSLLEVDGTDEVVRVVKETNR